MREVARPVGELTAGLFFGRNAISGARGEKPKRARGRVGGVSGGLLGAEVRSENVPSLNCYAESAIGSLRRELLRHVRIADAAELQLYLDEWRRYVNTDRAHQGIEGRTPEERSTGEPVAEVISLAEIRARRLVRREYAKGLLHGYDLVANDVAGDSAAA